jgi:lysophospholipid acyltransferase (LPLAT)-like uncharacterized protein
MIEQESPAGKPQPELRPSRKPAIIGFIVWAIARAIGMTLRVRFENPERLIEATAKGGAILVSWHGRTLIPASTFRGRGYWALISLSRDGEIQNHIFRRFGYQTIRGSTGRGGVRAVLQLARKIREGGVLAFTPDGPRGPTHKVQQGTIFLAQKSGCPILPLGISARPRKLLGTWDSYMIPMPFGRGAFVFGEPIVAPPDMTEEQTAEFTERVEIAINRCEKRSDEMLGFQYPKEYQT